MAADKGGTNSHWTQMETASFPHDGRFYCGGCCGQHLAKDACDKQHQQQHRQRCWNWARCFVRECQVSGNVTMISGGGSLYLRTFIFLLKLEIALEFPTSTEQKYLYLVKIDIARIDILEGVSGQWYCLKGGGGGDWTIVLLHCCLYFPLIYTYFFLDEAGNCVSNDSCVWRKIFISS